MSHSKHLKGGTDAGDFFARAKSHVLKPKIINEDSNFVVVTYWWGRGNLNKNTQRPCPEEREEIVEWEGIKKYLLKELRKTDRDATEADIDPKEIESELKAILPAYKMKWSDPKKFEQMISDWESACKKHKCNFLAEEYSEFAVKGGYQHAINFKPYFIDLALQACYPRSVLYIDGDMLIKKYPGVCDIKDVDFMARGWNTDPRVAPWDSKPCFDPYTFETSGGTMFFGNTYYGRMLLKFWEENVLKYPGKADDRILAFTIMKYHLLTSISIIQLPMEYLWMTLDYDVIFDKYPNDISQRGITITHPECLTGEERAEKDSSAVKISTRVPNGYVRAVENKINCRPEEIIYEYIHFDDKANMGAFKPYFEWLARHKAVTVVPFSQKYGSYNKTASKNVGLYSNVELQIKDSLVIVTNSDVNSKITHKVSKEETVVTILKYLMNKQHVVYVPQNTRSIRTVVGKAIQENLDFVTKNSNTSSDKAKREYILKLDKNYPIFFGPNSKTLRHLLLMSSSIDELEKIFNESYLFLTRIHCGWV
jgi:hypothetical protein